mgnify:CR=1 FL=1
MFIRITESNDEKIPTGSIVEVEIVNGVANVKRVITEDTDKK